MPLDHFDHQAKLIIDNKLKKKKKLLYRFTVWRGSTEWYFNMGIISDRHFLKLTVYE